MGGYCHKRNFSLRYTDFDFKDDIKFSSILGLAQEGAKSQPRKAESFRGKPKIQMAANSL